MLCALSNGPFFMCALVYSDNYVGTLKLKKILFTLQDFGAYGITHDSTLLFHIYCPTSFIRRIGY